MIESVDAPGAVVIVTQSGPCLAGADLASHRVRLRPAELLQIVQCDEGSVRPRDAGLQTKSLFATAT